jgi:hypothetical protein
MTDIVVRLRNVSSVEWSEPMCVEAADEIERLRRERDAARRERDEAHYDAYRVVQQGLAAAKATGYARGVEEIERLRRGWLRTIQGDNSCTVTGAPCAHEKCACVKEMELLSNV